MLSNNLAYKILSQKYKTLFIKIDLLDWSEEKIGEIGGMATSGSLSIQGNSSTRRTCSLTMEVQNNLENIANPNNLISINKKIRINIGISNNIEELNDLGDTIWFPLGIFVLTSANISRNNPNTTLNITATDKMCLLDGSVSGIIEGFLEAHQKADEEGNLSKMTIEEIIYYVVAGLGGEQRYKILIKDVPAYYKTPLIYEGEETLYFDSFGNPTTEENAFRIIKKGEYAGYTLEPFYYPGELIKSPGESITSILDSLVSALGNYEYFYDINGNFIFQEIPNYLNTSYTQLTKLTTGDYIANYEKTPYVFSFREKDIITSYTNNPNWQNIKNEFIVWGSAEDSTPVMFHLAIDDKPNIKEDLGEGKIYPWQQYLIDYGKANLHDPGKYYGELVSKFPQIYDAEKQEWKGNSNDFKYYFDMIDTKSVFGQYSVSSIGKRPVVVNDSQVGCLFPPVIPDYVILNAGDSTENNQNKVDELNKQGQKFLILDEKNFKKHVQAPYSKDAFSVVRELLYKHTSFNESITINSLPLYFLDANQRIEVYDTKSNIFGDYMISSINIPFSPEGTMNLTAVKAQQRI